MGDADRAAAWAAAQQAGKLVLDTDADIELGAEAGELLEECSAEEWDKLRLELVDGPRKGQAPDTVEEQALPEGFAWNDAEEGTRLQLLDNFALVTEDGKLAALELLDRQERPKCFLFGTVVEPKPLAEGETPRLWERAELAALRRTPRLVRVECSEWCLDLTYGDESIWVISRAGLWYKLRGEHGPGSALRPCPVYVEAFREARQRYEACLHTARLLQDPSSSKRPATAAVLRDVVALSKLGEWPLTDRFLLSRAEFVAEQVESVQNFSVQSQTPVGAAFAKDLLKKRVPMIVKLAKADERRQARKRPLQGGDPGGSKQSKLGMAFPADDQEVLELLRQIESGETSPPLAITKPGIFPRGLNGAKPMPWPPEPTAIFAEPETAYGLDYVGLGRLLSSFEALRMLADYLGLAPFSLTAYLEAAIFRPDTAWKRQSPSAPLQANTPSFASPLFVEVVMRVLHFVLDQPENEALEARLERRLRGAGAGDAPALVYEVAGVPPLLTPLTWPQVLFALVVEHEQVATPGELDLVATFSAAKVEVAEGESKPDGPGSSDAAAAPAAAQGKLRQPQTLKRHLERAEALFCDFPRTIEAYALQQCGALLRQLMDDPRAGPFSTKVDPVALGIPDYFTIIEEPMDLGTVHDRLQSGYYCPESTARNAALATLEAQNLQAWAQALCGDTWDQGWFFEARLLFGRAKESITQLAPVLSRDHAAVLRELRDSFATLAWVLQERGKEILERDAKRKAVFAAAEERLASCQQALRTHGSSSEQVTQGLNELLALQGYELLPPMTFHQSPLGVHIGDTRGHIAFVSSIEEVSLEYVPDIFRVGITNLFEDQVAAHTQLGDNRPQVGDLLVAVGPFVVANVDNNQAAQAFKQCPFPLQILFARKTDKSANVTSALRPPAGGVPAVESASSGTAPQPQGKEDEQGNAAGAATGEGEDDDGDASASKGLGGGVDAFFADVQLVFHNCVTYNNKRAEITTWALKLKERFEALYQERVTEMLERIDDTRDRLKQERARKAGCSDVGLEEVLRNLDGKDIQHIPPAVRAWLLEWLVESMLQTESIRTLIESGRASPSLAARVVRPRGRPPQHGLPTTPTGSVKSGHEGYFSQPSPTNRSASGFGGEDASAPATTADDALGMLPSPLLRLEPLGEDRFRNRYWWFDGDHLGRIFVEVALEDASEGGGVKMEGEDEKPGGGGGGGDSSPAAEQLRACKRRAWVGTGAQSGVPRFRWGVLSTRTQLDQLVQALSPLGRREVGLLHGIAARYHRIVSRMECARLRPLVDPGSMQGVVAQKHSNKEVEERLELAAKVSAASRTSKKRIVPLPDAELPGTQLQALAALLPTHLAYRPRKPRLASTSTASAKPLRLSVSGLERPVPALRQLAPVLSEVPGATSNRDLLVRLMETLEQAVWESRCPRAMGKLWPWPSLRKAWKAGLAQLVQAEPHVKETWQRSAARWEPEVSRAPDGGVVIDTTYEVAVLAERMLQLEAECIAYRGAASRACLGASCVNVAWHLARAGWRREVRRARSCARLAVLLRRLAVDAVRWQETDRALNILFTQHPGLEGPHMMASADARGLFWERDVSSTSSDGQPADVTFGQVVSSYNGALDALGFVGVGAFLGAHLHAALFGKTRLYPKLLSESFAQLANRLASQALAAATSAAHTGAVGLSGAKNQTDLNSNPIGRLTHNNHQAIESLGTIKKALLQVMATLRQRQKDVAEQIGCSQSHLSLWLNARDAGHKKRFELRVINWIRIKNLVHHWVRPVDVPDAGGTPMDIHAGIQPLPSLPDGMMPGEAADESLRLKTFEAVLPLIRAVCEPVHTETLGSSQPKSFRDIAGSEGAPPRHPFRSICKSSPAVTWLDVVPFVTSVCQPRVESPPDEYSSWISSFSPFVKNRLECSQLSSILEGTEVVYFPEGHAFANAHSELCMGVEMIRGGRAGAFGPPVPAVFPSRAPVLCEVVSVTYHLSLNLNERFSPSPYCVLVLQPTPWPDSRGLPMLDVGLPAELAHRGSSEGQLAHVLFLVLQHLLGTEEAALCTHAVSVAMYADLEEVCRPAGGLLDLAQIQQRLHAGEYSSVAGFLSDLERMAHGMELMMASVHYYGPNVAQAAAAVLMRAKLLLRHPETVCALDELSHSQPPPYPKDAVRVVLRPHFESAMPTYVVSPDAIRSAGCGALWKVGMRVVRRGVGSDAAQVNQQHTGVVVGFRHAAPGLQLPWASLVVRWDAPLNECDVDNTLDMPQLAYQQVNPWEVQPL